VTSQVLHQGRPQIRLPSNENKSIRCVEDNVQDETRFVQMVGDAFWFM
jgi:hypothetical protein